MKLRYPIIGLGVAALIYSFWEEINKNVSMGQYLNSSKLSFLDQPQTLLNYNLPVYWLCIACVSTLLLSILYRRNRALLRLTRSRESSLQYKYDCVLEENIELKAESYRIQASANAEITELNSQLKQKNNNVVSLARKVNQQQQLHQNSLELMKAEFEQKRVAFVKKVEQESVQRTHVQLVEIQDSYDRLYAQYEDLKQTHDRFKLESCLFDVNFDGAKYESLLKGRKFEIFFAKQLLEVSNDFEILQWTSDKGVENGIKVKNNGDPDFLISYKGQKQFAVECKYRGGLFDPDEDVKPRRVSWGAEYQAKRYKLYQRENRVPVFVALALKGEPDLPEKCYLVELKQLCEISRSLYWKDKHGNVKTDSGKQMVAKLMKGDGLFEHYVDGDYARKLLSLF